MKLPIFTILTTLGSLIWNTVLVLLGAGAGSAWEKYSAYADTYSKVGALVLLALFIVAVIVFFKKRIAPRIEAGRAAAHDDKN